MTKKKQVRDSVKNIVKEGIEVKTNYFETKKKLYDYERGIKVGTKFDDTISKIGKIKSINKRLLK